MPKLMLGGVSATAPGLTAVPVIATATFEFAAVDVIARLPVTGPAEAGVKVTWKVELWPAAMASGKVRPLILTPAPVAIACEMVALVPPEFVKVTVWLCVFPSVTLPKATLVGKMASCPVEVPSPATGSEALVDVEEDSEDPEEALSVSEAVPLTVTLPLVDPEVLGANVTVMVVL